MIFLKKIFYRFVHPLRLLYWFLVQPKTSGVKCLIEYNGKFLFIRNTYGKMWWTFPGGGVKLNETPEAAVKREIKEEVSINLAEVQKLGEYLSRRYFKRDTVYCFLARVSSSTYQIDKGEIIEAAWFDKNNFPKDISFAVPKVLEMYKRENI